MTKHLLAGAATVVLMSGIAFAQTYPPAPPPMPPVPPAPIGPSTLPPTVAPSPDGDHRASTIEKGVDTKGNEVTKKDVVREGVEGSTETHTTTKTDPETGDTTTRSTTTTTPR